MKRAVIYARYSSEKQSDTSIDDQVYECRRFAERHEYQIIGVESDKAASGGAANRPGLRRVMESIQSWDVLLVYDFARLHRDGGNSGTTRTELKLARKTAIAVSTGLDIFNLGSRHGEIQAEEYLRELGQRVHVTLSSKVRSRFWPGWPLKTITPSSI